MKSDNRGNENPAQDLEEQGTGSALHDIRHMAAGYREECAPLKPQEDPSDLGDFMLQSVLLPVVSRQGSDKWKLGALVAISVLGVSTAVLAVSLYDDSPLPVPPSYTAQPEPEVPVSTPKLPPLDSKASSNAFVAPQPQPSGMRGPERHVPALPPKRSLRDTRPAAITATTSETGCDEVACLIDSSACCPDHEERATASLDAPKPYRPYRLTRQQALQPLRAIGGRVRACFDQHDFREVATVKIIIAPSGEVQDFDLKDGSPDFQRCVERLIRPLEFDEVRQPFTLSYPFTYR